MGEPIHNHFLTSKNYNLWMLLLAVFVLSNHTGHCAAIRNASELAVTNDTNVEKILPSKTSQDITGNTGTDGSTFPNITKPTLLTIILALGITMFLYCMIFGYLNSQSLIRQCLLLYIYKDLVCICLGLHSLWFLLIITHYMSDNGHDIPKVYAKIISFFLYVLICVFLIFMNLVAMLKLYMMKKALVDPPMPWGDNEKLGMIIIRTVSTVPVIIFTSTMFLLEEYQNNYNSHPLENNSSILELPKGNSLFAIPLLFFVITFFVTYLATYFLRPYYESTQQHNIVTGIPSQIQYVGLVTVIVALGAFIIIFDLLPIRDRWSLYISYNVVSCILPLIIILFSKQLKLYVKSYVLFDMWFLNVNFVIMCLFVNVFVGLCVN